MLLTWLHPEIRRRIAASPDVFTKKLLREDLRRWDEEVKPDSIARNRKVQDTPVTTLGDAEFLAHLDEVRVNADEMIYRHHMFTIPCSFPVGHFVSQVQRWTGLPSGEVLGTLKGAAPISRGVGAGPIDRLRAALAASGITAESVRGRPAQQVLDDLKSRPGVGEALQAYLNEVAYRVVSGVDIGDKYALEMPEMLVGAIFGTTDPGRSQGDFTRRRDALRAKVPEATAPSSTNCSMKPGSCIAFATSADVQRRLGYGTGAAGDARSGTPPRGQWRLAGPRARD